MNAEQVESRELEILSEIRDSEKKADGILERAKREKDSIIQDSIKNSSKLLSEKEKEERNAQEKKVMDFREKVRLIREEKLAEGKAAARLMKAKAEKNIMKASDLIIKKFEEAA